ncbi:uncharacterized protein Aud_005120 [Aspergillus udagawae]|uniref:Uncharacterized protein n=1 Tax=Aspergillus udagawae TaxID=91492 RepID=A0A8E0UWS5_9EURO|nr:uncharacterized protein Aud_005120 [Aspergillus udagawae]GIC88722.1 hypothetical protein Aud_005120 [Aspergillus udagawae]
MDTVGPTLEELFTKSGRYFGMRTLLLFAEQMLARVEFIHSRNIYYGSLDSWSFALGSTGWQSQRALLVDFDTQSAQSAAAQDDLYAVGQILAYFYGNWSSWDEYLQKTGPNIPRDTAPVICTFLHRASASRAVDYPALRSVFREAYLDLATHLAIGLDLKGPRAICEVFDLNPGVLSTMDTSSLFESLSLKLFEAGKQIELLKGIATQRDIHSFSDLDEILTIYGVLITRDRPSVQKERQAMGAYHLSNRLWRDLRSRSDLHYMPPADSPRYFTSENWWYALTSAFAKELQVWYANSLQVKSADYDATFKKNLDSFYAELSQLNSIRLLEELASFAKMRDRSSYDQKMNEIKQANENGMYPSEWMPPALESAHWASPPTNKVPSTTPHPAANPSISSQPQPPSSTQMNGHPGANSRAMSAPAAPGGQLKVTSVRPRVVKRRIEPGMTATGEPIRYIQKLGEKRANFVVEGADGSYPLVSSAAAGGVLALEGAVAKGVPFTVQREAEIQRYKERVRNGGEYGCFFVAIGELDVTKERLPFIVVGFHHSDGVTEINEAISRSNLA